MHKRFNVGSAMAVTFGMNFLVSGTALAQSSLTEVHSAAGKTARLEEIVVTAERRESTVQRTPIAITAIGGDAVRRAQALDIEGLANSVPSLSIGRNESNAKVFIRGIGLDQASPGSDPRVAVYTDGVFNARSQAAFLGLYDVARIEVLAGPQGTLYGRNATAGAINIITKVPTDSLDGYGSATFGNYGTVRTEGAVSGPLSDEVSARIAFQTANRNGFGKNILTGADVDDENSRAVRGKLAIRPSASLKIIASADYYIANDHAGGFHLQRPFPGYPLVARDLLGFRVPDDRRDNAGSTPDHRLEVYGGNLTGTWATGPVEIVSVTAYRHTDSRVNGSPVDGSTGNLLPVNTVENGRQFSQEVRASTKISAVDIIVGAYYFHEKLKAGISGQFAPIILGLPAGPLVRGTVFFGRQSTEAWAGFSQATVHVTDRLGVDLGIRYSSENRRLNELSFFDFSPYNPSVPFFQDNPAISNKDRQKAKWTSWDPKITLHYEFSDTGMVYATYSEGFKSGGFNIGFAQPPFNPEGIKDYEIGLKTSLFDRKLRANLSAFYYDYTDLQVNINEGLTYVTRNAASSKIYGIEASISAVPGNNLRIDLNGAWVHARYKNYVTPDPTRPGRGDSVDANGNPAFDLSGKQITYTPEYKVNGQIAYTLDFDFGSLTPRLEATWVDKIYFTAFNYPAIAQRSHTEVNAFLDLTDSSRKWQAGLYVKNVFNRLYAVSGTTAPINLGFGIVGQYAPPRTFGATLTRHF